MSKERRRVSRDQVLENAKKGGAGGSSWFSLKEGVSQFSLDKAGSLLLDILPFEVGTDHHPDEIQKGYLWYKLPFSVHHGIGAKKESLVCPRSAGQRCPICEERDRLYKEGADKNEDVIDHLRAQKFVAYNIVDPADPEKVAILCLSRGKFAATLENELKVEDNAEHRLFFETTKDGRTLKVRFSDATFEGKKYLEATRIDFRPREAMDENAVLDKVLVLDSALIIPTFEKLKDIFLQTGGEAEEAPPAKAEEAPKATPKPAAKDDEDEPAPKKPAAPPPPPAKPKAQECPECDEEFEAEDAEHSDKLGKDFCSKKCKRLAEETAKPAPATSKPKPAADDDDDDPPAKAPAKAAEKAAPAKDGDKAAPTCPVKGGRFGKDLDKFDECDDCPHWNACEEATES